MAVDGEARIVMTPRWYVAVDRRLRSIVLAIRGTAKWADVLTDVICTQRPFMGGEAHSGILQAVSAAPPPRFNWLLSLVVHNTHRLLAWF